MAGFTLIEDQVLGSAAASITFSTGLTDYTKFRLTLYGIKDASAGRLQFRCNGDTGSNYARQTVFASGTGLASARATTTSVDLNASHNNIQASTPFLCTLEVVKPLSSLPARMTTEFSWIQDAAGVAYIGATAEWNNTADLISSISILASAGDFAIGTRAVLEGAA